MFCILRNDRSTDLLQSEVCHWYTYLWAVYRLRLSDFHLHLEWHTRRCSQKRVFVGFDWIGWFAASGMGRSAYNFTDILFRAWRTRLWHGSGGDRTRTSRIHQNMLEEGDFDRLWSSPIAADLAQSGNISGRLQRSSSTLSPLASLLSSSWASESLGKLRDMWGEVCMTVSPQEMTPNSLYLLIYYVLYVHSGFWVLFAC